MHNFTIKLKTKIVTLKDRTIVKRDTIDTPNTHIHDISLFWLDKDTSMESGGLTLILCHGPNFHLLVK